MPIVPVPERVRAFELDPAMPSGALPIFGEYLDRLGDTANRWLVAGFFVVFGVAQFLAGAGVALPVGTFALAGAIEARWLYRARAHVPETRLKREAFRQVDITAGGLVAAGRTVGVRLPDGRWLRVRLDEAHRLLVAGHRRVWLLGRGPKVFVGFAGVVRVRRAGIHDTPPPGALPVPQPAGSGSPRLDPVLTAHRRQLARDLRATAAFLLLLSGFAVWVGLDVPVVRWVAWTFGAGALLGALAAVLRSVACDRPLPADHWTELRAVLDGPVRMGRRGSARLSGLTMLADGRVIPFRLPKVDPSMAANIAATGRLWIAGAPAPGAVQTGVPGYPVLGTVWLG
ncbi:hypothetical protein SAMN04489727_1617 [Amycolatopsis tolypomycina]|uniref:Uncharacterized protein n=1 Tax=Amycolatopsis tolypomycina TaxID=208445 RepID=A0A1H4J7L2_9PSEU|nr:hypothetical protein [Amycolatopsis tolypomycina]SEB42329.1 hypothetical protein SAMN04489727_1617 [Amycolatopsis tolypomycina]